MAILLSVQQPLGRLVHMSCTTYIKSCCATQGPTDSQDLPGAPVYSEAQLKMGLTQKPRCLS